MLPPTSPISTKRSDLAVYAEVIRALMLRDMRTRFGASYWGYVVVVLWPVAHIFLMVAVMFSATCHPRWATTRSCSLRPAPFQL